MMTSSCVLTPAEERRQAPAQRIRPHRQQDEERPFPWQHADGGQRARDDEVTVDGDHHQRDHGADPKEGAAEGVELAACRGEWRISRFWFENRITASLDKQNQTLDSVRLMDRKQEEMIWTQQKPVRNPVRGTVPVCRPLVFSLCNCSLTDAMFSCQLGNHGDQMTNIWQQIYSEYPETVKIFLNNWKMIQSHLWDRNSSAL